MSFSMMASLFPDSLLFRSVVFFCGESNSALQCRRQQLWQSHTRQALQPVCWLRLLKPLLCAFLLPAHPVDVYGQHPCLSAVHCLDSVWPAPLLASPLVMDSASAAVRSQIAVVLGSLYLRENKLCHSCTIMLMSIA